MAHSYEELKKLNVAQLRNVAREIKHEAVQGATQMNKEHLLVAICKALNIDMHEHHVARLANKGKIKASMKALKKKRDEMIAAKNYEQVEFVRHAMHALRRKLRRAMA